MPEWKYLESEAFQTRYVLAAHMVRDCNPIFEIGGYMTPISGFIQSPLRIDFPKIVSIDPRMDSHIMGTIPVQHIGMRWPDAEFPEAEPRTYALVILGLELHLTPEEWEKLYELVADSKKTILGVVPDHIHSVNQYEQILKNGGLKKTMEVTLDLSQNDFGDMTDSAPPKTTRRIVMLE